MFPENALSPKTFFWQGLDAVLPKGEVIIVLWTLAPMILCSYAQRLTRFAQLSSPHTWQSWLQCTSLNSFVQIGRFYQQWHGGAYGKLCCYGSGMQQDSILRHYSSRCEGIIGEYLFLRAYLGLSSWLRFVQFRHLTSMHIMVSLCCLPVSLGVLVESMSSFPSR